ncbi:MAG TPA: hypothetical protein VHR42_02610 [Clostridia bacterium]|nr:hypothetical protein [Clostridia bacterium]
MDDITSKLGDLFSSPEGMEKVKNLMSMLTGPGGPMAQQEQQGEPEEENHAPAGGMSDLPFDPMLLMKMKSAMELMNKGDPRVDLLQALKPNLSQDRRKKIDEAIHLMRLINLMPLLKDQGFL